MTSATLDRSRSNSRWLAVTAAVFAGLFLAGAVANMYVSRLSSMSDIFEALNRLALSVMDKALEGVQADLTSLRVEPRWVAVLVTDVQGKVLAAEPQSLVGLEVEFEPPFAGEVVRPHPMRLQLWEGPGAPSAVAHALGLGGPDWESRQESRQFRLTTAERTVWTREGELIGHLFAVVRQPVVAGLSLWELANLLDNATLLLFVLATFALAGWVWADARRREVDGPVAWALLTLFTNVIGWATYLVVRGRQRPACPNCGRTLRPAYRACPFCGVQVRRSCPSCGQAVEEAWSFCAHCAAELH